MRILICDDELPFCHKITESITSWFDGHNILSQCSYYTSPQELLRDSDIHNTQIAFLDVEMQPYDGIELGRKLKEINRDIIIVYVSAYLEFAIDGYQVNAFRYLLKRDLDRSIAACLEDVWAELSSQKVFKVKVSGEIKTILYRDIYYFESDLRKVHIWGDSRNTCILSFYEKLPRLTAQLESSGFLRISRSYLVNMSHIQQIKNYHVLLNNGVILNTTRPSFSVIQNKYLTWKGSF